MVRKPDLGGWVIRTIEARRDRMRKRQPGAAGKFWRDGGKALLHDLPVTTESVVVDAGGYRGEWAAEMLVRYGCSVELYEPIPKFAEYCARRFQKNALVTVHNKGLGGSNRTTSFAMADDGTSEFGGRSSEKIEAAIVDAAEIIDALPARKIACLKLNIEGGEYEVLERLVETEHIASCDCLLIQFHSKPPGYRARCSKLRSALQDTHVREWCYEMVWEKWVAKGL